ncbi:MAG TPA: hemolysin family protein [Holophaga sp.]|nr:hemolysin family protein [Holophaga sp.]
MTDPSSSPGPWLAAPIFAVIAYRALVAALLEAHHALPSLQRRRLLEEGAFRDPRLARLLEKPHALGLALSLWNQALLVFLLGLVWPMATALPGRGLALAPLALAYIWIMDLALPNLVVASEPATWIARLFRFYAPLHPLLAPLAEPIARFVARRRADHDRAEEAEEVPEEAVTALLEEGEAEGILEEDDRELIRNVVEFGDTVVREVMTPRTLVQGVPLSATREEAWELFRTSRHSRMPLYDGTIDQVVGILLLKDLMQVEGEAGLRELAKPPCFVPESKNIGQLLREMQRDRQQLAVVVDEFGSVSGVVTLEDLLEEVFGEIHDEHEVQADTVELGPGEFLLSGQTHVEDLEEITGWACERDGFDTLGGLVMARLGRIPEQGESVVLPGMRLTVHRMEGRRILQVHVKVDRED